VGFKVGRSRSAGLLNERITSFFYKLLIFLHSRWVGIDSRVEIMYLVALPYNMFRHPLSPIDLVP
jgi:hypothetical protein